MASQLFDACQKDLGRPGPEVHGGKTVGELFAAEKPCLLPLQSERFAACCRRWTFVDSHALVRADNVRYSVPVQWAYHACTIEIFVDQVRIVCQGQVVAVHARGYEPGQFVLDPQHYLKLLGYKPGSLDNARPFKGQPWGPSFDLLRTELEYRYPKDGTRRYIQVLLLFTKYPCEEVQAAVELCVRRRAFSEDAVLNVLRNEPLVPRKQLDLSGRSQLLSQDTGVREARIYDQLKSREEVPV